MLACCFNKPYCGESTSLQGRLYCYYQELSVTKTRGSNRTGMHGVPALASLSISPSVHATHFWSVALLLSAYSPCAHPPIAAQSHKSVL